MTPSKLGAVIAVCFAGLQEEASADPPPATLKLSEPFTVPMVELTHLPPLEAQSERAVRPLEPMIEEDRCPDEARSRPIAVRPEPAKMQQFDNAQVVLRWTLPHITRAAVVFEQSSQELDLRRCLHLRAVKLDIVDRGDKPPQAPHPSAAK
jgi:hypothetical protein